jgi:hypothetical protein
MIAHDSGFWQVLAAVIVGTVVNYDNLVGSAIGERVGMEALYRLSAVVPLVARGHDNGYVHVRVSIDQK